MSLSTRHCDWFIDVHLVHFSSVRVFSNAPRPKLLKTNQLVTTTENPKHSGDECGAASDSLPPWREDISESKVKQIRYKKWREIQHSFNFAWISGSNYACLLTFWVLNYMIIEIPLLILISVGFLSLYNAEFWLIIMQLDIFWCAPSCICRPKPTLFVNKTIELV